MSSTSPDFAIGVGNAGQIIHFVDGDGGTLVPSGTSKDLLDVWVVDENFAVATGQDVVMLWDGSQWTTEVENTDAMNPQFFTPAWAPPEKDRIIYQQLATGGGFGFNFICPLRLPENPGGFCKASSRPVLSLCGNNADTKALLSSGTIVRYSGGTLSNQDDPLDGPVFEQPAQDALNLIAAYMPEGSCLPGNLPPREIFAINQVFSGSEFWRFDGSAWSKQGDAGPGQTLTGMAGAGGSLVVAVGRQPSSAMKGPGVNDGVAWLFNGTSWAPESLPPGAPGLADVTLSAAFETLVFADGFEAAATSKGDLRPGISGGFWAMGENGLLFQRPVFELPFADLALVKTLVDPVPPLSNGNPVRVGDIITYALQVTNNGPDEVPQATVNDVFFSDQLRFVESDCQEILTDQGTRMNISFNFNGLMPGQSITCRPQFEVLSIPLQQSGAAGVLNVAEVRGSIFDTNLNNNKDACLIDNNEAGSDGNRVQCDVEEIFILLP